MTPLSPPSLHPALLFVILALANYRLTRLITDDRIFQTPVARIQRWAEHRFERAALTRAREQILIDANEEADNADPPYILTPDQFEALHLQADALTIRPHTDDDDQWRAPLAYLLSCPWCLSLYTATALTISTWWATCGFPDNSFQWFLAALLPFALSATTGLLSYIEHTLSALNGWATQEKDNDK